MAQARTHSSVASRIVVLYMYVLLLAAGVSAGASAGSSAGASAEGLEAILQTIADENSQKYQSCIGIGVVSTNESVSVISGNSDETKGAEVKAKTSDRFIWGSITKVITGSALLRLHDQGKVPDLDAKVSELVDPLLTKMKANASVPTFNFTKLSDLWGPETDEITLRHLATMKAGLPDFDTARPSLGKPTDSFRATVLANPTEDFTPLMLLTLPWVAKGKLEFPPGSHFSYSSTNFVLLGLAICASLPDCNSWDEYDQGTFLTPEVATRLQQGVAFGAHGSPSDYSPMHGYDRTPYNGHNSSELPGSDFWKVHGAFSGWTASDICMSAGDAAAVNHAIYSRGGGLLSPASQHLMQSRKNSSHSGGGMADFYTFATMDLSFQTGQCTIDEHTHAENCSQYGEAWGHIGATYGYDSTFVFYPALNLSLAIGSNTELETQGQVQDVACVAYNRIKNFLLKEPVEDCKVEKSSYYARCTCYAPGAPTPAPQPPSMYKCSKILKQCLPSHEGTQTRDECANACQ